MRSLLRGILLFGHMLQSLLTYVTLRRRNSTRTDCILCFTHFQDLDRDGRDRQMGPLTDEILERNLPLIEITQVPLWWGALSKNKARKKRPFLSHAAILGMAKLIRGPGASREKQARSRERVAGWILRNLGIRKAYLIDESGSGQTYVRACLKLGIPVYGIQHGDFQPGNPQYDPSEWSKQGRLPPAAVNCLFTWSPWFRSRLIRISPIYHESNTLVAGRLRNQEPESQSNPTCPEKIRILLISEPSKRFHEGASPYVARLEENPKIDLRIRRHPAEASGTGDSPEPNLALDLAGVDIAVGNSSSALLEALELGLGVICLTSKDLGDPARYAEEGLAVRCDTPDKLEVSIECALDESARRERRERVWGTERREPARFILDQSQP